jgi:hypothetical protein
LKLRIAALLVLVAAALTLACGQTGSPLAELIQSLNQLPEYSIILEDMRIEGNFFREYQHQYKVVQGIQPEAGAPAADFESTTTDWERVSRREYETYQPYLGMVIASKSEDGQIQQGTGYPPGYQYAGNPRYGQWRQDASGNSFWEFAGKYAVLSAIFNMANRPIYRNDWDGYRDSYNRGRPFFGRNRQFGTDGSYTKQTHPTFFQRRLQRERASQRRFSQRVRSRMSGARSRSRGFGK